MREPKPPKELTRPLTPLLDDEWEALRQRCRRMGLEPILAELPRSLFEESYAREFQHPTGAIVESLRSAVSPSPAVTELAEACRRIGAWRTTRAGAEGAAWWRGMASRLASDPREAGGALAEIRAFGTMLAADDNGRPELGPCPIPRESGPTPDFSLSAFTNVFVEVCAVQPHASETVNQERTAEIDAELTRIASEAAVETLDGSPSSDRVRVKATSPVVVRDRDGLPSLTQREVEATRTRVGQHAFTLSMSLRESHPAGPTKDGSSAHTMASSIAGRKKSTNQIPNNAVGVLWMDFLGSGWVVPVAQCAPIDFWYHGQGFARTPGLWHAFYGNVGTPMFGMAPVALGLALRYHHEGVLQRFPGRFMDPSQRKWGAAVLRCTDGLVVFENPDPETPLPMPLLRQMTALPGYRPEFSLHRWDAKGSSSLNARLADIERSLRFVGGVVDVVE